MAEKILKRCSVLLVTNEMQIKRTLRIYLTPARIAKIKNSSESIGCQGRRESGTLSLMVVL